MSNYQPCPCGCGEMMPVGKCRRTDGSLDLEELGKWHMPASVEIRKIIRERLIMEGFDPYEPAKEKKD